MAGRRGPVPSRAVRLPQHIACQQMPLMRPCIWANLAFLCSHVSITSRGEPECQESTPQQPFLSAQHWNTPWLPLDLLGALTQLS